MHLDLSAEETAALTQELHDIFESDRYPFSARIRTLRPTLIIRRIGHTRRYEPLLTGLRAMTALLVLRDKAIKPLLAAAQPLRPTRGAHNPTRPPAPASSSPTP